MRVQEAVRRAQAYEQDQLADFCAEAFHAAPDYFLRRWRLDPARGSFGLVLEDEGDLVGYVHVYERYVQVGSTALRCAGLGNVAVSPRHRGRGQSMRLLENCLHECVEDGFDMSLLYTHIHGLYERLGFIPLPFHEVDLAPGSGEGWQVAGDLTEEDRQLYEQEHGRRPGTMERSRRMWDAREGWLRPEGWRILKHEAEDGYCYARFTLEGGIVDEATGGCARRLEREAPRLGAWRRRLPNSYGARLGITPSAHSRVMARGLDARADLEHASWAEAALWQTDSF